MAMAVGELAGPGVIAALHGSGRKAGLAITGGGSGAIAALLRVPGGSRLLVEAQVPYDEQALAGFLGFAPGQACSAETAIAMARQARARAALMVAAGSEVVGPEVVGLGATAALASDRPRRGEHRVHVASASAAGVAHCTLVLAKGRRDRAGEEDLAAQAILLWLARACGVAAASPGALLDADERFAAAAAGGEGDAIEALLAGAHGRVTALPDGQISLGAAVPEVVFPGSFNPLHRGHVALAAAAAELRQAPVAYELSVTNVDKPGLAAEVVRQRVAQFAWQAPVELTRAPTFLEKSQLFPGATFVIGADTAERLVAPRYYGGDAARMEAALEAMGGAGTAFLVAVRVDAAARLRRLGDVAVPGRFADLFREIPEGRFRVDLSSTEIRGRG